jgi:hypothetical protein
MSSIVLARLANPIKASPKGGEDRWSRKLNGLADDAGQEASCAIHSVAKTVVDSRVAHIRWCLMSLAICKA